MPDDEPPPDAEAARVLAEELEAVNDNEAADLDEETWAAAPADEDGMPAVLLDALRPPIEDDDAAATFDVPVKLDEGAKEALPNEDRNDDATVNDSRSDVDEPDGSAPRLDAVSTADDDVASLGLFSPGSATVQPEASATAITIRLNGFSSRRSHRCITLARLRLPHAARTSWALQNQRNRDFKRHHLIGVRATEPA